jgi:hypothetical protein
MQELVLASPTETFAVARGPPWSNPGHELRSCEAPDLQPSNLALLREDDAVSWSASGRVIHSTKYFFRGEAW